MLIALRSAINSLKTNKGRTLMTVVGISIGIAMVMIVLSAGGGVKSLVLEQVSSFGDNWINIEVKVPNTGRNSTANVTALAGGVNITTLTEGDAAAIKDLDNVSEFYAGVTGQFVVTYENERERPTMFAVTPGYFAIDTGKIAKGRVFTQNEQNSASQVVVLGHGIAIDLFGQNDPIGKTVKIDKKSFSVIGVMQERGATGFFDMDKIVMIPLKTAQKKLMGIDHVLWIIAQVYNNDRAADTADEIVHLMRERHDITDPDKDDFAVTTQAESIEVVNVIFNGITWLLVALAAISLLVGGVGIMNVMYVSVAERTFEIGLRKAVGAGQKDIRNQFLAEAVLVTLIGGIIGMIIGIAISLLAAFGAQSYGFNWPYSVSLFSIILGVGFSTAVGVLFGTAPANAAAKLDPIVAMRAE